MSRRVAVLGAFKVGVPSLLEAGPELASVRSRRSGGQGRGRQPRGRGGQVDRRPAAVLVAAAMGIGVVVLATLGAAADSGQVSPQYQGYGLDSGQGQDPYSGDNPQDIHVDGFGGRPVVDGYVRLNLDSLPSGSTIDGLRITLTPNGSQNDNINSTQAAIEACILDQPLTSNGYQATPPPYDCNAVHANGEQQNNGTWIFELAPLARRWMQSGNTGLALVGYPPPNGTSAAVSPTAWAVAFDHTKTVAAVDYTPPAASPLSVSAPATTGSPSSGGSTSGTGGAAPGTTVTAPSGGAPPAVGPAPAVHPAPAVAEPTAAAAPSATPAPSPAAAAAPVTAASSPPPSSPQPQVNDRWVVLTATLGGAALLMLIVGAGQHVLRPGAMSLGGRVVAAFSASRSQFATPVAVLALASVFALGFTGATPNLVGTGSSSGSGGATALGGAGGSGTAGGGAPGAAGPGSGPTGLAAPGGSGPASGGQAGLPGQPESGTATAQPGVTVSGGGTSTAASNNNGGQDGPGVTSNTVRIGFVYVNDTQAANNLFGLKVPNPGNEQSEEQTLVDYVNKHGGIAGRQIQPVYVQYSNSQAETDPNIGEEICHTFTEDYHVFAVIGGAGPPDDAAANSCYAQAGTLNFDGEPSAPDLTFLRQASPYIWMTEDAALDRTMGWEIAGLRSRGFFSGGPTYKLGVVVAGDPVNERVWQQDTLPALRAAGVSSPDEFVVPHDTLDDTANTMKQAVIHFQADGVTNVIFQGGGQDGGGSYAVLFLLSAESQHYNPRYGFSTDDAPVALTTNVPEDQFQGPGGPALSIGTLPGADTDDQHYAPWPSTPNEKTCASIEAGGGNTQSTREGALVMMIFCDSMFELQAGGQALTNQPLNAQLWADQVMKLGSNVFNAALYSRYIGPNHWDSAGGYRLLHAVQNCEGNSACFEFDNSTIYR